MSSGNVKIVLLALFLLFSVGVLNRWVRSSRASSALAFTDLSTPLSEIPVEFGPYSARDIPLRTDVMRAAGVDTYLQREYVNAISGRRLLVYIGYWGRENVGMGHGPEVCYPSAGWNTDAPAREHSMEFVTSRKPVPARMALHRFVRAAPEGLQHCAVGFIAVVGGEYQPASRGMFWHRSGRSRPEGGHYLAQIHVSAFPPSEGWEDAEADIIEFMGALLPEAARCLPHAPGAATVENDSPRG